jgi:pilus assembly protein CpaB
VNNSRSVIMLVLAVVSGLGAMYGTTKLLSKNKDKPVVEMQDVLVAARDLKIEEVVKADLTKVVRMAKDAVPIGSYSQVKDVEERWVMIGMLEGEPIVDKKLAQRGLPPGLVSRIPKGMRAFAIDVNEQTGVSGFILPDHRVDVVMTEPNPQGQPEAETVLQDVLVLASGTTFVRLEDRSIQARTVTLAVSPDQVGILVAAKARGMLTLALRGVNDHEQAPKKEKAPPPEPPKKPEVVVAKEPEPPPPPPPPAPAPLPPPPPAPPVAKPARYLTIWRASDMKRHRIDQPPDLDTESPAAAAPPIAPAPAPATPAPAATVVVPPLPQN